MLIVLGLGILWIAGVCLAILDGRRKRVGWLAIGALTAAIVALVALGVQVRDEGPQRMVAGNWEAANRAVRRLMTDQLKPAPLPSAES